MSDWPISIRYEGKPLGKGRPRFGKGRVFTPPQTIVYEQAIGWLAKEAMIGRKPLTGPIALHVRAFFHSDKEGPHIAKPDIDNVIKAVADSLNKIVYEDDSQIAISIATKNYWNGPDEVRIDVRPLTAMSDS